MPLAPRTTLGVGGPARFFLTVTDATSAAEALRWAQVREVPVFVLGGGSNLLVADDGFPGLVLCLASRGIRAGAEGLLTVAAGEPWEAVVEAAVARGWAGLECLTGIPGTAGAAPVQNIGAYGQEVAERLVAVHALDRRDGGLAPITLSAADCGFGYRDSRFKRAPADFVVLDVELRLEPGGAPGLHYEELRRSVTAGPGGGTPDLATVRRAVRALRHGKAMLLDWTDADGEPTGAPSDRASAGSFFTNPVVSAETAAALPPGAPRHPQPDGQVKLSAAWLIEAAGLYRGFSLGPAALSTRHCLALVNRGGARAADVVRLAAHMRRSVRRAFGVALAPEPVFLGFHGSPEAVLDAAEAGLTA